MLFGRLLAWFRRPRREAYIQSPQIDSARPPARPKTFNDPIVESARLYPPVPRQDLPPLEPIVSTSSLPSKVLDSWAMEDELPPPPHSSPHSFGRPPARPEQPSEPGTAVVPAMPLAEAKVPAPVPVDPRKAGAGLLKMVMADGSVAAPSLDEELERQVAYLAREILAPDPEAEAALAGPGQLKVILEDGSVVTPEDPELQSQIEYLATEILSSEGASGGPV